MNYNNSQLRAICHKDGPMMVLAGPGSGKTAVITQRTKYLITEYGINPSNILVITFTKAAALEMKQRFCVLMQEADARVTFGTFHAVFFMVLKVAYHMESSNLIQEELKYQLMREILSHHMLDYKDEKDLIAGLLSEISRVKNSRIDLEKFESGQVGAEVFREIFREYDSRLRKSRRIDFDDMLTYTYELFTQRPDILSAWQKKYQYILIDEFQDINPIQYDIMRMLAAPEDNLFIVGDDDQSIYRFRGSAPEIMLNFNKDYPAAERVLLDVNYRCDGYVVRDSLRVIAENKERFEKKIKNAKPVSHPVIYRTFREQKEENEVILETIRNLTQAYSVTDGRVSQLRTGGTNQIRTGEADPSSGSERVNYRDIAILFRTNAQPRALMEVLMGSNIPFRMKEHVPNLYEHWIARDILTYLKVAAGSRERKDFLTIMNRPKRYIGRDSLPDAKVSFRDWQAFYWDKEWIAERIKRLEYDLKMIARMSPYAAINYIRRAVGYDDFIKEYAKYRKMNPEELMDVLEELHNTARGFKSYREWQNHMQEYSANLRKLSEMRNENPNAITLATLHGVKGLEYKQVFIIDANEGLMPYKKAVLDRDLEEERRMFYVGMTRAIEQLYVFSTHSVNGKDMEVSRFVLEAQGKTKNPRDNRA